MKECCETCRYFEEWYGLENEVLQPIFGYCEMDGEEIDIDPTILTCFNWEPKDD